MKKLADKAKAIHLARCGRGRGFKSPPISRSLRSAARSTRSARRPKQPFQRPERQCSTWSALDLSSPLTSSPTSATRHTFRHESQVCDGKRHNASRSQLRTPPPSPSQPGREPPVQQGQSHRCDHPDRPTRYRRPPLLPETPQRRKDQREAIRALKRRISDRVRTALTTPETGADLT